MSDADKTALWNRHQSGVDRQPQALLVCSMEDGSVSRLRSLLERLAQRPVGGFARSWAGPKPSGNHSIIASIASKVGLDATGREPDFDPVSVNDASIWLTLFATQSLLHGERRIPAGIQEEITDILAGFGPDAQFFSKGLWQQTRRLKHFELITHESGWERSRHRLLFHGTSDPLPPIEVLEDGGLIGFDSETAFAFWVEEDD